MDDATAQAPPSAPAAALVPVVLDADREPAYLLWAVELDGNAADVARRLGIPPRTVQHWARTDGWPARRRAERAELARVAAWAAQLALAESVRPVVGRLIDLGLGRGDTKTVLDREGNPVTVELPVPYQAQVNAIKTLAQDFGLADAIAALRDGQDAPADDEPGGSSPQELHERMLQRRHRRERAR